MAQGHVKSAPLLLQQIRSKEIDPKDLKRYQRMICTRHLLEENPELSERQIAIILGTSHSAISRYINKINKHEKRVFSRLDPHEHAAELRRATLARVKKLEQASKWEAAARVHLMLTDKLMDLGVLARVPVLFEGSISLMDILRKANDNGRREEESIRRARLAGGSGQGLEQLQN